MPTLADTTVLNNFAQIRRTDLLRSAYADVSAPIPVWNELELGATGLHVDAVEGRWVVETWHAKRPWEVIVEPDEEIGLLIVVTAYPVS